MLEKKPLPLAKPEEMGVPAQALNQYIREIENAKISLHSILVVRHNHIIAEGYFTPMDKDFRHRLYSCSKSIVSCAVGLLIAQGKLHLDDPVISFFPDKAPREPHPYLKQMTIRHLLMMATCYDNGASYKPSDPDWEATFFTEVISHEPGTVFSYCTTATTMLCMIIKRVSGMEFTKLLRPVFDEIGVSEDLYCIETPCGHEWGGSGVMATAREFAKIANLCMHYGEYEGKQLLPRDYMIEATSKQIDNTVHHTSVDTAQGYGYQFWCVRNGGFLLNGMGCQYALCLPKEDLLVVTTGYEQLNIKPTAEVFDSFWRNVYPVLQDKPCTPNEEADKALQETLSGLTLVRPDGESTSPSMQLYHDKVCIMTENRMGIQEIRFTFTQTEGTMHYKNATGTHAITFSLTGHAKGKFPETHYNGKRIGTPLGKGLDTLCSAAWSLPEYLMIYCQVVDMHLANLRISVYFGKNGITLTTEKHAEFFLQEYAGFASGHWV